MIQLDAMRAVNAGTCQSSRKIDVLRDFDKN